MTDTKTDEAAWLEWRKGGIGGSDVASILNLSTWGSPFTVWCDKLGIDLGKSIETPRQRMGKRQEAVLAEDFTDTTGLIVVGEQAQLEHPEHPHRRVTLDGWVAEAPTPNEPVCPWECKSYSVIERDGGRITLTVRAQVLWALHVAQREQAWVSGMGAFLNPQHIHFEPTADDWLDLDYIIERVDSFWFDNVIAGVQPEIDGSEATARAIAKLFPVHQPGASVALDDLEGDIDRLFEIRALEAAATKLAEAAGVIENRIKHAMGHAEIGTLNGEPVFSLRTTPRKEYTVPAGSYRALRKATKRDKD